jgi:predicted kinase
MKNKLTMTLMVGLARCGKSTYVKKNSKDVIVCPDRIRKLIFGHQFHKDAEDFVWAYAKGMAKLILEQGKNVLIDATNLNFYSREQWYKIAKDYKAKIKVIWIKTSLKECKKRNAKSPEGERLPEGTLDNMAYMFENPTREFADWTYGVEIVEVPYKGRYGDAGNIYQTEITKERINGKQNKNH